MVVTGVYLYVLEATTVVEFKYFGGVGGNVRLSGVDCFVYEGGNAFVFWSKCDIVELTWCSKKRVVGCITECVLNFGES